MPAAARLDDHFHVGCCCFPPLCLPLKMWARRIFPTLAINQLRVRGRELRCTSLAFPSTLLKEQGEQLVPGAGGATELSAFGCSNCCGIIFHIRGKVHGANTDSATVGQKQMPQKAAEAARQCNQLADSARRINVEAIRMEIE